MTVNDTKSSDGKIKRSVNISLKVEVLNSSSNKTLNTQGFANALKSDLVNTYSSMSGQTAKEIVPGSTRTSSTMAPTSSADKYVDVTYEVNVNVDISVISSASDKAKDSHLVEILDDGTKGKLGESGGAYGRAPFYGNQVYINEAMINDIVNGNDNNTGPHEFGHTAGFIHPDQHTSFFGLIKGEQYLDYNKKNINNLMWSNKGSYKINDRTSIELTLKQLQILIRNYKNEKLNNNTIGE